MLSVNDNNCINLLLVITDTILESSCEQSSLQSCSHVRKIYDELQALWMCVMANSDMSMETRRKLETYLCNKVSKESSLTITSSVGFPKENGDDPSSENLLGAALKVSTAAKKENVEGIYNVIYYYF